MAKMIPPESALKGGRPPFTVSLKIRRPIVEVFGAVVDDRRLSLAFISDASGPLVAGQTVKWKFPEFPEFFDVHVLEVTSPERIVLAWGAADGDYDTRIELTFKPLNPDETLVSISESGWRDTPEGEKAAYDNAGGWMYMLSCLKASLEYGINLRDGGAF